MYAWNRSGALLRRCVCAALLCPFLVMAADKLPQRKLPEHPFPSTAAVTPQLPPGFSSTNAVPGARFNYPTALAFAADGFMLVAEKAGVVWAVEHGVKDPVPFIDIRDEVLANGDRGLMGLALDPHFLENGRVYLAYVVDPDSDGIDDNLSSFGRVVRYTAAPGDRRHADHSSRTVLLGHSWSDGVANPFFDHTIDALRWGSDGTLLVSAGDGGHYEYADAGEHDPNGFLEGMLPIDEDHGALRAQTMNSLSGKILRIDPESGGGIPSNPWYTGNPDDKASKVWCIGLRNPFRFTVKPGTGAANPAAGDPGELYIPDCGWMTWEEVNVSKTGGTNFGWPCKEGFAVNGPYINACTDFQPPVSVPYTDPVYSWHHTNEILSVPPGYTGWCAIGGIFYTGTSYPDQYRGALFVADYQDWIRVSQISSAGFLLSTASFASGLGEPVDMAVSPVDGDIYYVSLLAGEVRRIRYDAPAPVPSAKIAGGPVMGDPPLAIQLSGANSLDGGGGSLMYEWADQDGTFSTDPAPIYTANGSGPALVTLRVTNQSGYSDTAALCVIPSPGAPTSYDVTSNGEPVVSRGLTVVGRAPLSVIRDNRFPSSNDSRESLQFITEDPVNVSSEDWFGISFPSAIPVTALVFQNGIVNINGGGLVDPRIEVFDGTSWNPVPGYVSDPPFAVGGADSSYTVHAIRFPEQLCRGVRIIGAPTGMSNYASCAEFRVVARTRFPVARCSASPLVGRRNLSVQLSSSGSSDPSGMPLSYFWTFGDGESSSDSTPVHVYASAGVFHARLLVTTTEGSSAVDSSIITVLENARPSIVHISPADSTLCKVGTQVLLSAAAVDPDVEDSALTYHWQVDLHHNLHVHPEYLTADTRECYMTVSGHGDNDSIRFEVHVTVADAGGLRDSAKFWILPNHPPRLAVDTASLVPSGAYVYQIVLAGSDADRSDSLRLEPLHLPPWMNAAPYDSQPGRWIVFGNPPAGNQPDTIVIFRVLDKAGEADTISFPLRAVEITNEVTEGWNLVSLSRIVPVDSVLTVFPTALSPAFSFTLQRYVAAESMTAGRGYWLKFPSVGSFAVGGVPFLADTLILSAGWNIVGTPSGGLGPDGIQSVPPGSIISDFFGYANGYAAAGTLVSGKAYWVKVSQPCTLILTVGSPSAGGAPGR